MEVDLDPKLRATKHRNGKKGSFVVEDKGKNTLNDRPH